MPGGMKADERTVLVGALAGAGRPGPLAGRGGELMECDICRKPTEPSPPAYNDARRGRVCLDCIQERRYILTALERARGNLTARRGCSGSASESCNTS
jgi:hypothetical protein